MANMRLRAAWEEAARDLGIEVECPFTLSLADGVKIEAEVLVKNFGRTLGMLLFPSDDEAYESYCNAIDKTEYGWSVLFPSYETYERDHFVDTLSDWGWTGERNKHPSWLLSKPRKLTVAGKDER